MDNEDKNIESNSNKKNSLTRKEFLQKFASTSIAVWSTTLISGCDTQIEAIYGPPVPNELYGPPSINNYIEGTVYDFDSASSPKSILPYVRIIEEQDLTNKFESAEDGFYKIDVETLGSNLQFSFSKIAYKNLSNKILSVYNTNDIFMSRDTDAYTFIKMILKDSETNLPLQGVKITSSEDVLSEAFFTDDTGLCMYPFPKSDNNFGIIIYKQAYEKISGRYNISDNTFFLDSGTATINTSSDLFSIALKSIPE